VDARRAIPAAAGLTLTDLRASASTRDISSRTRSVGVLVHAMRSQGSVGVVGRNSLVSRLRSIASDIDRIAACECPCVKRFVFLTRLFEANETGAIYFESYKSSDFRFNLSDGLFDPLDAKCNLFEM